MSRKSSIQDAALAVVRRLREHGHEALWAGGCVRDMLLGQEPKDIDVATNATPEQIVALFRQTRKVGMQFGVVLVKQSAYWIEVATFREDINYADGRRPERVVFTSDQEDAKRRDFTINGLFYDPLNQQVIDYVGGRDDLAAGVIRAIGNPAERFAEDHLRMLRAVRFAARLGFRLDPVTADAIRDQAASLARITPERIAEELRKMLIHPSRAQAIRLLLDLRLMPHLWPGAEWPADRADRAAAVLAGLEGPVDFALGMAALLHDRAAPEIETIGRALRCSNREIEEMIWLAGHQERLAESARLSLAEFKRLAAHPRFEALLILHRTVCKAYDRSLDGYETARRLHQEIPSDQLAPPPLITGDDLIRLGLQPGPDFKRILDVLYTAQLNNQVADHRDALAKLAQLLSDWG